MPRWRHDRQGLELAAAAAAVAVAAVAAPGTMAAGTTGTAVGSHSPATPQQLVIAAAAATAAGSSSPQPQTPATTQQQQQQQPALTHSSSSSSSNGDAVRVMLEGQLASASRDLRAAQHSIARLEGDLAAAAEAASGREAALTNQVHTQHSQGGG